MEVLCNFLCRIQRTCLKMSHLLAVKRQETKDMFHPVSWDSWWGLQQTCSGSKVPEVTKSHRVLETIIFTFPWLLHNLDLNFHICSWNTSCRSKPNEQQRDTIKYIIQDLNSNLTSSGCPGPRLQTCGSCLCMTSINRKLKNVQWVVMYKYLTLKHPFCSPSKLFLQIFTWERYYTNKVISPGVGQGQCPWQTALSPANSHQLFRGHHKTFPGQPGDIITSACPWSAAGPPPGWACVTHLPRRNPNQVPKLPQLVPPDAEEQVPLGWLNFSPSP